MPLLGSNSVINTLGGAIIGAWIGYFASQVVQGDWDGGSVDRAAWAAGGAIVGSVSGFAVSAISGARGDGVPHPGPSYDVNIITTAEIRQAGAPNLYVLITALRPDWLILRGVHSMQETPKGRSDDKGVVITDPGRPAIPVYMDGVRIGGLEALRQISPAEATVLEFLPANRATQRFGAGHSHGAIEISTR